jgi:hypothetical protein
MLVPCSGFVSGECSPERFLTIDEKPRVLCGWMAVKLFVQ